MKHYIIIACAILMSNSLFAQSQQNEGFFLNIILMNKDAINGQISISDIGESGNASLSLIGTNCLAHQQNKSINISDTYYYQQFRDYLTQIDLATFEPSSEDDSALQIKIIYQDHSLNMANEMYFGYNPENFSELNTFFEYLLETMNSNITRSCDRDFYDKVKAYLEGEE